MTTPALEEAFAQPEAEVDLSVYCFEDWLAMAFFWVLAATVFWQFFTRYAMNDSASWTEEIARYLLICMVFIGAAISVRKNNHIQVDFFYRILPKKLMRLMSTLVDGVRIAFLGYAVWLTWVLITKIGKQPMAIVDWPIGIVYAVVMLGFVIMTFRAVQVGIANLRRGASTDGDKKRALAEALEEGKIEGDKFEKAVAMTPLTHCSTILENLNQCWDEFEQFERIVDENYRPEAPSARSFIPRRVGLSSCRWRLAAHRHTRAGRWCCDCRHAPRSATGRRRSSCPCC